MQLLELEQESSLGAAWQAPNHRLPIDLSKQKPLDSDLDGGALEPHYEKKVVKSFGLKSQNVRITLVPLYRSCE